MVYSPSRVFNVSAVIVPKVTCDLLLHSIPSSVRGKHLSGLRLVDLEFGTPGWIDLLLGVESFVEVMCNGWRIGAPGTPVDFKTHLGWYLPVALVHEFLLNMLLFTPLLCLLEMISITSSGKSRTNPCLIMY